MPLLFVNGTNDFAYPMDSMQVLLYTNHKFRSDSIQSDLDPVQKTYRVAAGPVTLCVRVEIRAADSGGPEGRPAPLARRSHRIPTHFSLSLPGI